MTHQKRLSAPKHYPIEKKDQTYITTSKDSRSPETSIPTLLFLREVTNYADTKKEATQIVKQGKIKRNGQEIRDIQTALGTLDTVEIEDTEEKYRVITKTDKLAFQPLENAEQVTAKIVDKALEDNQYVYRLHNGENLKTEEEYQTENTLIIENEEVQNEIEMEENQKAIVIQGKHAGKTGEITQITRQGRNPDTATLQNDEEEFQTRLQNLVAINQEVQGVE